MMARRLSPTALPLTATPRRLALLTMAALAVTPPVAVARTPRVAISPAPGTPDASPATQLSLLGVAPGAIRSVRMVGGWTGVHRGRLGAYSRGRGASFLPVTSFAEGEPVRAVVRLRDGRTLRTAFTVARFAPIPPILNLPQRQPAKLQSFESEPTLAPPRITVLKHGGAGHGSIFLTPLPSPIVHPGSAETVTIKPVGPGGPMIIDGAGRLVWFRQLEPPEVAADLRVGRYRGRRVLTWWEGSVTAAAYGLGSGVIADSSYRTIRRVRAGNGYGMDLHELALTPDGDALFTVYSLVLVHLPGTPAGSESRVLDSVVQEIDVATGLVVWEWHGLGHIPLAQSYATAQNSAYYDAFHINSVQALPGRRVLISARNTSAVYEVDRVGGRIRWTLGGKASDFRLGPGARFWFQHDAELLPGDRVSVFDDEAGPPRKAPSSRGLVLALDRRRGRARVEHERHRSAPTSAQSEGSVQWLPGGGAFVGWGAQPFFSQFGASGRLLFDATLPEDDGSYRAYRHTWQATPRTRPAVAATRTGPADVAIAVSWNGATRVRRWQVVDTSAAGAPRPVASAARSGFETRIVVRGAAGPFAVRALDGRGRVLGTSAPVRSA
jgi:hypothetical protein